MSRTRLYGYACAALVTLILAACEDPQPEVTVTVPYGDSGTTLNGRPVAIECPNVKAAPTLSDSSNAEHTLEVPIPLAGVKARIPEYHDCQRLIGAENQYGALVGIFASAALDTT